MPNYFNAYFSFNVDSFAFPRAVDFTDVVERPYAGDDSDSEVVYFVADPSFPDDPDHSSHTAVFRGHDVETTVAGLSGHVHEVGLSNADASVGWDFYSEGGAEGYEVTAQFFNPADPTGDRALFDLMLAGDTIYRMSSQADTMRGGDGDDTFDDDGGNDWFYGDGGKDTLSGGAGNDMLDGGSGRDSLIGEAGRDILAGGAGADVFAFSNFRHSKAGKSDTVTDFGYGADVVHLQRIDADTALEGDQAFAALGTDPLANGLWSAVVVETGGTFTYLYGDTNGDLSADLVIRFTGTVDLDGHILL